MLSAPCFATISAAKDLLRDASKLSGGNAASRSFGALIMTCLQRSDNRYKVFVIASAAKQPRRQCITAIHWRLCTGEEFASSLLHTCPAAPYNDVYATY